MFRFIFFMLCCASMLTACSRVRQTTAHLQSPVLIRNHVARVKPVRMPLDSSHVAYSGLNWSHEVFTYYKSRNGECFWFSTEPDNVLLRDSVYNILVNVCYLGLSSGTYHVTELDQRSDSVRLEALLTDSFLSLAHDVKYGRCTRAEHHRMNANVLDSLKTGEALVEYIRSAEPAFTGYRELKAALRNVLDSSADVEADQLQHELNLIYLNLDRWRKLPMLKDEPALYILVNIPAYSLSVIDHDSIVLQSRIIVGKPESPTPELVGIIDRITINPYWYVPRKIAVEEYLPLLQTDTSFLSTNNFEVLDRKGNVLAPDSINWKLITPHTFRVTLRQRTGPG